MKKILSIVLFFLLTGCRTVSTPAGSLPVPTAEPSIALPATPTHTAAMTLQPTKTATSTIQPSPTTHARQVIRDCFELSPSWKEPLPGVLVLEHSNYGSGFFIDMASGQKSAINQDGSTLVGDFAISPDKNWLAYSQAQRGTGSEEFVVQSLDGVKKFATEVDDQKVQTIAYWLNNDVLLLWNHAPSQPLDTIDFYNPFTEEQEVMPMDYPGILPFDDDAWDFSWPSITIYAPTLDHLVYLKNTKEEEYIPNDATLVLWDRKAQLPIKEVDNFGYASVYPLWKADGSGLIFVKANPGNPPETFMDEIFYLSVEGDLKQLTNLAHDFQNVVIFSYQWSPDEQYLAFEMEADLSRGQTPTSHLMILEMNTIQIVDTCLDPYQFTNLVWSPDGRYLAYSEQLADENTQAVVIDLETKEGFALEQNLLPVGWMSTTK